MKNVYVIWYFGIKGQFVIDCAFESLQEAKRYMKERNEKTGFDHCRYYSRIKLLNKGFFNA